MKPIKFKEVEIRGPRYDPHPEKSKTNNSKWRMGLFVIFEDYEGNVFDWMPKWEHLDSLNEMQKKVERVNQDLARKHMKNDETKKD